MTATANDPVRYAVADGVARIDLDSPHNRNALSAALVAAVTDRLADATADAGVRVVVLGHTGRTFCAGADLSGAATSPDHPADPAALAADRARELAALLRAIVAAPLPVVAAVDGHVRAGGLGLLGACDIVVAGPSSTFALTEARLGLAPAIISMTLAPRLAPRAWARYALTGETLCAAEAQRVGLVTVAADDVAATVEVFTDALRRGSPQGLAATKALVAAPVLAGIDADADRLAELSASLFCSEEAREGMLAFLGRRPPRWAPDGA